MFVVVAEAEVMSVDFEFDNSFVIGFNPVVKHSVYCLICRHLKSGFCWCESCVLFSWSVYLDIWLGLLDLGVGVSFMCILLTQVLSSLCVGLRDNILLSK